MTMTMTESDNDNDNALTGNTLPSSFRIQNHGHSVPSPTSHWNLGSNERLRVWIGFQPPCTKFEHGTWSWTQLKIRLSSLSLSGDFFDHASVSQRHWHHDWRPPLRWSRCRCARATPGSWVSTQVNLSELVSTWGRFKVTKTTFEVFLQENMTLAFCGSDPMQFKSSFKR